MNTRTNATNSPSWNSAIIKAHEQLVESKNTQVLGKIRQEANEYMVQDWLRTRFKVYRHAEMTKEEFGPLDSNCTGWDILEPETGMRIQVKYRGGKSESNRWHMEQTRRTSGKNEEKSHNGQVRYSDDEFDVMIFTSPSEIRNAFHESDLIAIPVSELKDLKKPGFLVGRVPPKLVKKWQNKNPMEVIKAVRGKLLSEDV